MIELTFRPQVKNPNRFSVFSGEEYLFSISRYTYRKLGEPATVSVEGVEAFQMECMFPEQYDYCLGLLSRRGYSSRELKDKLSERGVPLEISEKILARLTEEKLICDEEFSKSFARSRQIYHKQGFYKIRQDLAKKGISFSREDYDEEREQEVLKELVAKLVSQGLEPQKIIQRLMRKGFRYGDVVSHLKQLSLGDESYEEF